jgi:protein TonB
VEKEKKQRLYSYVPMVLGTAVVVAVVGLMVWFAIGMMEKKPDGPKRQTAQVIKIVRPPPPPEQPPPPPPPEKVEEPLPQDTPEPTPAEDSPAEQLGVDADGSAGGDGFGLAARKGGRDILGGGNAFGWYTTLLKDTISDSLSEDDKVRRGSYQILVRVWLSSDGRVERIKLASTSGKQELDTAIEQALTRVSRVREAPPIEMPQPITLRIVSRS